jgi:Amt family ammonium transporter
MVAVVKSRLGYDDSLDAFGVHGAGGTLGALLTGVFAMAAVNPMFHDEQGHTLAVGLLDGNAHQVVNQLVGVLIAWGLAIVGTLVLLKVTDLLVGVRVSEEQEVQGLDISQHGEIGYDFE